MEKINKLKEEINRLKENYNKDLGYLKAYEEEKELKEKELSNLKEDFFNLNMKKILLEKASESARANGKEILCGMATSSVQSVLGEHLEIFADFYKRNGVSVSDILVKSNYNNQQRITDPSKEEGGGLADVVSLSLFMSMRLLIGDKNVAPNFLDEPTKYLSRGKWESAGNFIRQMVDNTETQTFIVTHDREYLPFLADNSYELSLDEYGNTITKRIN